MEDDGGDVVVIGPGRGLQRKTKRSVSILVCLMQITFEQDVSHLQDLRY